MSMFRMDFTGRGKPENDGDGGSAGLPVFQRVRGGAGNQRGQKRREWRLTAHRAALADKDQDSFPANTGSPALPPSPSFSGFPLQRESDPPHTFPGSMLEMIDVFLGQVEEAEFMELLPQLRMAFAYFTPAETDKAWAPRPSSCALTAGPSLAAPCLVPACAILLDRSKAPSFDTSPARDAP